MDNRKLDDKIQQGYFSDKLVAVSMFPNKELDVIGKCIALILANKSGNSSNSDRASQYPSYMPLNADWDLRPELVQDFPCGGVITCHAPASGKNLRVLDLLNVKYVIVLRHPADQIVSTHEKYLNSEIFHESQTSDKFLADPIYPLEQQALRPDSQVSERLGYLITGGYLSAVLSWISDWLQFRDPKRSLVIGYEEFLADHHRLLNEISQFLDDDDLDEKTLASCNALLEEHSNNIQREMKKERHTYFNEDNDKSYKRVVGEYLLLQPNAKSLLKKYPELLETMSSGPGV